MLHPDYKIEKCTNNEVLVTSNSNTSIHNRRSATSHCSANEATQRMPCLRASQPGGVETAPTIHLSVPNYTFDITALACLRRPGTSSQTAIQLLTWLFRFSPKSPSVFFPYPKMDD